MQEGGKFAKGAAFQGGSVVSTPTYFPMSGGKTGLMGEAGAEAVMPLSRAPDGSLGVRMDGGGGKSVVVNTPISISIESTGGDDKSTAQQTANAVRAAVLTIIQKEKMPGGSLYSR
jgi:phage-related minor tail protein